MTFGEELNKRIEMLKSLIKEKQAVLEHAPEDSIRISASSGRTQYYLCRQGVRKYMKKSELLLVQELCQKDYEQRILNCAVKELKQLEGFRDKYSYDKCEDVYSNMHEKRKQFITPMILPDDEYIKAWESVPYDKKGFREGDPEFYTEKGERVRSKTEILIANALYKHNIPYRYEAPLKLGCYGIVHPDFTILNVRLRKELYWEHMGMLDREEYRDYALEKINKYEKCDIYPGDKLILTHETAKSPINSKMLEKVLLHYCV